MLLDVVGSNCWMLLDVVGYWMLLDVVVQRWQSSINQTKQTVVVAVVAAVLLFCFISFWGEFWMVLAMAIVAVVTWW